LMMEEAVTKRARRTVLVRVSKGMRASYRNTDEMTSTVPMMKSMLRTTKVSQRQASEKYINFHTWLILG
jgi:hypothetical protein